MSKDEREKRLRQSNALMNRIVAGSASMIRDVVARGLEAGKPLSAMAVIITADNEAPILVERSACRVDGSPSAGRAAAVVRKAKGDVIPVLVLVRVSAGDPIIGVVFFDYEAAARRAN